MIPPHRYQVVAVLISLFLLIVPIHLSAGEITRKVGRGESLSLVCKDVYGDKDLYKLVALYNGKKDPRMVSAGETLRLPFSDTITLRRGESLSMLAKRIWGEPKMFPVLAWANGVHDVEKVPAGTRLAVPVLIPYVLKKGESVSSVAGAFYGNPKVYEVIINASRVKDPTRVPAGALLKIPYVMPKPVMKKAPKKVQKRTAKPAVKPAVKKASPDPEEAKVSLAVLAKADEAFKSGRYGDAWTLADKASRDLDGKEKAGAYRLMAATQYAFGKKDAALHDLKRSYELDPDFMPDPAYVNPEMMELYKRASTQDTERRTQ